MNNFPNKIKCTELMKTRQPSSAYYKVGGMFYPVSTLEKNNKSPNKLSIYRYFIGVILFNIFIHNSIPNNELWSTIQAIIILLSVLFFPFALKYEDDLSVISKQDKERHNISKNIDKVYYDPDSHVIFIDEDFRYPATRDNFELLVRGKLK